MPAVLLLAAMMGLASPNTEAGHRYAFPPDIAEACRSDNPYYAAVVYDGDFAAPGGAPAVVAVSDSEHNDGSTTKVLARYEDVKTVFGLAYDWRRGHLYVGAYHKAGIFPLDQDTTPGTVYRIDLTSGSVDPWVVLEAGESPHGPNPDDPPGSAYDTKAPPWVGKTSLADVEIDDEGKTLFVTNLFDRKIYSFAVPDGRPLGAFEHGAKSRPWAPNARPFGLGYYAGWLYHGVVDTREILAFPGQLRAYVFRSRADGSEMSEVLGFPLDYEREPLWEPWRTPDPSDRDGVAEPILADLEFRPGGDLVVGLRDRSMDGFRQPIGPIGRGDILPTARVGPTEWAAITVPEFYQDDSPFIIGLQRVLAEPGWGTLASATHADSVAFGVYTSTGGREDGLVWFDNRSGRIEGPHDGREPLTQGESLGLGDIELLCGPLRPTPTPTHVATATPKDPPTGTPTARATPTITPPSTPLYLPVLFNQACATRPGHADIALVVDLSTTMLRSTDAHRSKLAAAQEAAYSFLELMSFTPDAHGAHDQVAIVGFNETAWIAADLTANSAVLVSAVARLPNKVAEGTRLDLALDRGIQALQSPSRIPGNTPVLILLTDGLPNRVPTATPSGAQEETVLAVARQAKQLGFRLYTIGLGSEHSADPADRIDPVLLRAVATSPGMFYDSPDAEDLSRIYSEIATSVRCPVGWSRARP